MEVAVLRITARPTKPPAHLSVNAPNVPNPGSYARKVAIPAHPADIPSADSTAIISADSSVRLRTDNTDI